MHHYYIRITNHTSISVILLDLRPHTYHVYEQYYGGYEVHQSHYSSYTSMQATSAFCISLSTCKNNKVIQMRHGALSDFVY
jgi:hypothetical protein